jgi:hypothetical protein
MTPQTREAGLCVRPKAEMNKKQTKPKRRKPGPEPDGLRYLPELAEQNALEAEVRRTF